MGENWIRQARKPSISEEMMVEVRYLRFCPNCEDFQRQETIAEGDDRILRCAKCGSSEKFVMTNGVLVPEGTLPLLRSFTGRRIKGILKW